MSLSRRPPRGFALVVVCLAVWGCGDDGANEPRPKHAGVDSGADAASDADSSTEDASDADASNQDASDGDAASAFFACDEYEMPGPRPEPGITKVDLHTFGFEEIFVGSELRLEGPDLVHVRPVNVGCRFVLEPGKYTLHAKGPDIDFPPTEVEIPNDPLVTLVVYRNADEAHAAAYVPDLTPPGPGNWRITFFNITQDNPTNPIDIYYYPVMYPAIPVAADAIPLALEVAPNTTASVVIPEHTYYLDAEPTGQLTSDVTTSIINCGSDDGLDCVWSYTLSCDSGELYDGGYCDYRIGGTASGFSLTPPAN
jgi:hypothetical protein